MKKEEDAALDAYFAEGDSWARDRQDLLRRSRNVAWAIAGAATLVAVCEALALMALAPLKTVQPYTLLVDRQTGFVQALKPIDPQLVSSEAALTKSFLVQYVIAREGFDFAALQNDYRKVALWSEGRARADYLARMQASNPASPLSLYPRSTTVDVQVKSVTPIGDHVSMVRFDTRKQDAGGQTSSAQPWVAAVRYSFSNAAMSEGDRFLNPLGFKVLRYRRSAEVLTPLPQEQPPVVGRAASSATPALATTSSSRSEQMDGPVTNRTQASPRMGSAYP